MSNALSHRLSVGMYSSFMTLIMSPSFWMSSHSIAGSLPYNNEDIPIDDVDDEEDLKEDDDE